jgi:hypothetical protein
VGGEVLGDRSRHCEPTGRANARPMTSAKQSIAAIRKAGLLRRFAPRNDEANKDGGSRNDNH